MKKRTRNIDIYFRICIAYLINHVILATIDVNLSELEYLAAHLDPFECRRLVAALHYTSYELPRNLAAAERKVDEDIPCIRHLVHWNVSPTEGRGKTHEAIAHRLQQLNRNDLADWLTKTTFKQLGKDLDRALDRPFQELGGTETETTPPITIEPIKEPEEDVWLEVDTILMIVLLGSLGILILLIAAIVLQKIKSCLQERKYKKLKGKHDRDEKKFAERDGGNTERKMSINYNTDSSVDIIDISQRETGTDTDVDSSAK